MTRATHLVCDAVWKSYPRWTGGPRTLRGVVTQRLPLVLRQTERRWALQDVSLALAAGESTGLIGQNGAGKSTLLRIASGIGNPTRGSVRVTPRWSSVLSLGDTLDMELSGRENALTIAMVAGLSARGARDSLDAILAFAELEAFADAPVRTYSDGMKLRLAFGVMAVLEPELLLLDEVIAVGDLRFQARCMERIEELRDRGTSVLFASHSLEQVQEQCDTAVWLQAGAVRAAGPSAEVIEAYRDAMRADTLAKTPHQSPDQIGPLELQRNRFGSQQLTVDEVRLVGDAGPGQELPSGAPLEVILRVTRHDESLRDAIAGISITRSKDGTVVLDTSTEAAGVRVDVRSRVTEIRVRFEALDLVPGEYAVDVGVYEPGWAFAYDYHWHAYPLRITGRGGDSGVYRPRSSWTITS